MAIVDVWIGLVGVAAFPGGTSLGDAAGAYVTALAMASSSEQYESVVKNALVELGLFAFEFEDVETFAHRAQQFQLDEKLYEIADDVRKSCEVRFDSFYTYAKLDS